jgi:hypothetical protein
MLGSVFLPGSVGIFAEGIETLWAVDHYFQEQEPYDENQI